MVRPKKITGSTLSSFPGGTFDELVEDYFRRRGVPTQSEGPSNSTRISTAFVQLVWMGDTELPPGSAVVLTDPIETFEDNSGAPFSGLRFKCEAPTEETLEKAFAITCSHMPAPPTGKKSMGFGYVPNSCWAQVNIDDAEHEFADLEAEETFLKSGESGSVPIIHKPEGTGLKWCVVQLQAGGGGGATVNVGMAVIITEVTGKVEASGTITYGVGEAVPIIQGSLGEATYDTDTGTSAKLNPSATAGNEFKIYNFCGSPVPVGKLIHWTGSGTSYEDIGGPMKVIDAEDCG